MEHIILDTDICNEVDDQFALAYLIKSLKGCKLDAITIAPFSNSGYYKTKTIEEGTIASYETACKILDILQEPKYKKYVYKGATEYFFKSKENNEASEKIIQIAKRNNRTTIIAIGAITNVALAIYHAPDIVDKIEVVWLGGNSFLSERNDEYNFKQDVDAVREVFNSRVKLTVIPCKNVASQLSTTIFELEHYLAGDLGDYLCNIFKDCKKAFRKSAKDIIGERKTLWDISAVAYYFHGEWFERKEISCPKMLNDLTYKQTRNKHKITFVMDMNRHKIFQDFFIKMKRG